MLMRLGPMFYYSHIRSWIDFSTYMGYFNQIFNSNILFWYGLFKFGGLVPFLLGLFIWLWRLACKVFGNMLVRVELSLWGGLFLG